MQSKSMVRYENHLHDALKEVALMRVDIKLLRDAAHGLYPTVDWMRERLAQLLSGSSL